MKHNILDIFLDKKGNPAMREFVVFISFLVMLASWFFSTFFNYIINDNIFYAFTSIVIAGFFGYTFEKPSPNNTVIQNLDANGNATQ